MDEHQGRAQPRGESGGDVGDLPGVYRKISAADDWVGLFRFIMFSWFQQVVLPERNCVNSG